MSQDYTVAKELASLKEIKQSAEQRISDLSLNALNYVNDHRLHKTGGGSSAQTCKVSVITAEVSEEYINADYIRYNADADGYIPATKSHIFGNSASESIVATDVVPKTIISFSGSYVADESKSTGDFSNYSNNIIVRGDCVLYLVESMS